METHARAFLPRNISAVDSVEIMQRPDLSYRNFAILELTHT